MERLTYRSPRFNNPVSNGACKDITCTFECDSCKINDLIEKLCAYEDTGLEPQDIISAVDMSKIACALHELNAYKDLGPIDHLRDLLQAEQDGRLVVLPCMVGDTVYVIGEKRIMRCGIDEAYLDDKNGLEYLVSFFCDSDCDGCPFNNWIQAYSGEWYCDGEYGQSIVVGSEIGKTVFLTREEAALAQKGGDG